ncbi:MAG: hypothetical protein E7591_03110 [Ruminococcaceae bacterium]|nr:hypothetical protein [Oscillospiraceae bacterium]
MIMRKYISAVLISAILLLSIPFTASADTGPTYSDSYPTVGIKYGDDVIITPMQSENSYYITWESDLSGNDRVQYIKKSEAVNGAFPENALTVSAYKLSQQRYTAELKDLEADTEYLYRVGSGENNWSKAYPLNTYAKDKSFSFLFGADPQIGTHPGMDTRAWGNSMGNMMEWFGGDIEFFMNAGDQINEYAREIEYDVYKSPGAMRSLPQIVTPGNHDNGYAHSAHFIYENVDQNTLSDAGKYGGDFWVPYDGVLILSLNLNNESAALHIDFCEKAIAEYTALYGEPMWTFALFHQPFYSAGVRAEYDETIEYRTTLGAEFSRLGVDAVFNGHDHTYTRSYMVNGTDIKDDASLYTEINGDKYASYHSVADGDTVYITGNSASGSKYYGSYEQYFSAKALQENVPTLTKVDVTENSLVFTTYRTGEHNEALDVYDFFAIHRDASSDNNAPVIMAPDELRFNAAYADTVISRVMAYDDTDGDLTDEMKTEGSITPYGEALITFTVTDKAGNTAAKKVKFIPYGYENVFGAEKEWKYLDDGSLPFDDDTDLRWTTDSFDDSQWKSGIGAFGAYNGGLEDFDPDDPLPNTLISQYFPEGSEDEGVNIPTFFFRTTFDLADPDSVELLDFDFRYNDALNIYINGVNVIKHNTESVSGKGEYCFDGAPETVSYAKLRVTDEALIDSLELRESGNVIAVDLYQFSIYSEDIYFCIDAFNVGMERKALPFTDVPADEWYYGAVARAYNEGLVLGTSETTFAPRATMSRAAVWTVLARIEGADISVNEGEKWYEGARRWAMESGVSDGTNPTDPINRQQFAKMLHSMKGTPEAEYCIEGFADKDQVADWALDSMNWAVSCGLITGRNGTHLAPKSSASRAEACTILLRYIDN